MFPCATLFNEIDKLHPRHSLVISGRHDEITYFYSMLCSYVYSCRKQGLQYKAFLKYQNSDNDIHSQLIQMTRDNSQSTKHRLFTNMHNYKKHEEQ